MKSFSLCFVTILYSLFAIGQDKHCGPTMLMAPTPCELIVLDSSNDTTIAIVNSNECSTQKSKCTNGYWVVYSTDTLVVLEEFGIIDGKLDGVVTTRYLDGKLKKTQTLVNGTANGPTLELNQQEQITGVGKYKNDTFFGSGFT